MNSKTKAALFIFFIFFSCYSQFSFSRAASSFRIVGYYCGSTIPVDSFEVEKLTHLIFCFGSLKENRFSVNSSIDSATIKRMVQLKSKNPELKVMLSLGGWGGCR